MTQDEERKKEEAGSSRRQEGRRKVRKPDEEEEKLTELRWGHLGLVWVSFGVVLGGLRGALGVSCASLAAVPQNRPNFDSRWGFTIIRRFLPRRFP